MATNQKDGDNGEKPSNDGVIAPTVSIEPRTHSVSNWGGSPTRMDMNGLDSVRESLWMEQYGGERNLFDALGYITDPRYEHYRSRYERTDTASALVDKLPKRAWSKPQIVDPGAEGEKSEFEKQVNAFLSGEYTNEDPISVMERASRMERLGEFSLIFLGLADDAAKPEETEDDETVDPEGLLENEVDEQSLNNVDPDEAIQYLTPYDQGRVDINQIDWYDQDATHPRFGKPKSYQVDLGNNRPTAQIHYSRIIHVVGDVFDNELRSPSILKKSINRIDDIEKILGGSAEGYWRAAYTGLVISPPEVNGQHASFSDDGEGLHQQINRYVNNLSREIFTAADINTIDVTVEDPSGHLESQYKDISTGHDIPQSILMGNETGERATEEDRQMWHERVGDFRDEYCVPSVLAPIINRLIDYGVFAEPQAGKYSYKVKWPSLTSQSEQDEWNVKQTKSNTIATATGGNPFAVMTVPEYREQVLGWKPEKGSMAEDMGDEQMEAATPEDLDPLENNEVDEDDERVQEQFERLNVSYSEGDWVETPDGVGFVDDWTTEGSVDDKEGSSDDPLYAVVLAEEPKTDFYHESELESAQEPSVGPENPEEELQEAMDSEEDRENKSLSDLTLRDLLGALTRSNQTPGFFEWPDSWKESETPARIIAMKAWVSMGARHGGGSPGGCTSSMRGQIADPDRFCADLKDRIYGTDLWRGGWF